MKRDALTIAVVGPCTAGKSTLAVALQEDGYRVRQPAQEHSYVPDMWRKMTEPDVLIYLDVDYDQTVKRAPQTGGGPERLAEQHRRLAHARQHCDFYLDTSKLSPEEARREVLSFLRQTLDG